MGSWGDVRVGGLTVANVKNEVPPEVLTAFTDDMYRCRTASAADYYPESEPDEVVTVHEFVGAGPVVADRLDVLGFTPARVRAFLDDEIDSARRIVAYPLWEGADAATVSSNEAERGYLAQYGAGDWVNDLRKAVTREGTNEDKHRPGSVRWLMSRLGNAEERLAMRAALLALPTEEVRLDVTDLVQSGWLDDLGGLCRSGLEEMRAVAAAHAPVVVLAEGKSDIAVLEPALRLLYPHLTDLVRFMDYGERPMGGAGALVNTVRSFAAAGIANRVVALFDNDTAAADALRGLAVDDLPANIQVRRYPPLDLARDYPTLGPPAAGAPTGRLASADVNGLAGSIELYLGRDVLTCPDGALRPVQWRSYIASQGRYQGEIVGKDTVHQAYRSKVKESEADRARMADQDWSGLRAILDLVLTAFG